MIFAPLSRADAQTVINDGSEAGQTLSSGNYEVENGATFEYQSVGLDFMDDILQVDDGLFYDNIVGLEIDGGVAAISGGTFNSNESVGLAVTGGQVSVSAGDYETNDIGAEFGGGSAVLTGGTYDNDEFSGLAVTGGNVTVAAGEFASSNIGCYIESGTASISGGTFSGNVFSDIYLSGGTINLSGGYVDTNEDGPIALGYGTLNIYGDLSTSLLKDGNPMPDVDNAGGTLNYINAPTIGSLGPDNTPASTGFHLVIHGAGFIPGDTVTWNGAPLQVYSIADAEIVAGVSTTVNTPQTTDTTALITVTDPDSQTAGSSLAVTPTPPYIGSIGPNPVNAGGAAFTLTLVGNMFDSAATVLWNGQPLPTTFVSAARLTALVPANLIASVGSAYVTVKSGGGILSGALTETIALPTAPFPKLTKLSTTSVKARTAFTLTVAGTGFASGAVINFNGVALATVFTSSTHLSAAVSAGVNSAAGPDSITVTGSGMTSNALTLTAS